MQSGKRTRPAEIFFDGLVNIVWKDDHHSTYKYWDLRVICPCAGCVDELSGQRTLDVNSVNKSIYPIKSSYVGNYALQITWSDGHDSGIFAFQNLRKNCSCDICSNIN